MKTCSLQDFLKELEPWLDRDHIHDAELDGHGHLTLHFNDGMKNVYAIDDCSAGQMQKIMQQLEGRGIPVRKGG